MTAREKALAVFVLLFAVVFLFALHEWQRERDARIQAESVQTQQQKIIDIAKADQAKTAADLQQQIAALEAEKKQPITPQQFVVGVSKMFPKLPQPLNVVQPLPVTQGMDGKQESLPSAPVVEIPAADLSTLRDYKISCDETQARLDACAKDKTDLIAELNAPKLKRDKWEATAKGGSWARRALTAAKWIGIGAGVGYVAGHKW
jgi:hypothetical protein